MAKKTTTKKKNKTGRPTGRNGKAVNCYFSTQALEKIEKEAEILSMNGFNSLSFSQVVNIIILKK